MIRITVEMVSARGAERDRLVGIAYIANLGPTAGVEGVFNYEAWLSKTIEGRTNEQWKRGRAAVAGDFSEVLTDDNTEHVQVEGFDNVNRGVWDLLYLVLKVIVGRRNA